MPRHPLLAAAALGLLLAPQVEAQDAAPERNAAVDYLRGAYTMHRGDIRSFREAYNNLDWFVIGAEMDPAKLSAEFKAAADAVSEEGIASFIRGSRAPRCDFQIQYELGPLALLPHLVGMREGVRALRVDARRLASAGDATGSAERLAAIVRMAAHLRSDRVLISSLVAMAMTNVAVEEIDDQLDAGRLPPEARRSIADAFVGLGGDDPFAVKSAMIHGERDALVGWVKRTFHGPAAGADLISTGVTAALVMAEPPAAPQTSPVLVPPPGPVPSPQATPIDHDRIEREIAPMDEGALHGDADRLWPFYGQAVAAWDGPDAHARLVELSAKLDRGEFGVLAHVLAPNVVKTYQSNVKARAEVARIVGRLRE